VALGARRADEDREVHEIPVAGRAPIDDAPGDATAERVEVVYLPRARLLALVAAGLSAPEALARVDALRLVEANAIPEVASQIERLALEDPDESVRRIATRVLARGDGSDGRELLRRLARDVDAGVRAFALLGLSRRGEPGAEELLASCVEGARQAAPDLVPAIERLVASVRDD
jgi:HEAT repeat protein